MVALCGASAISDAVAELLGDWVKSGGGLLATYDSGLYRENGELRRDGGALRDILGVEMTVEAPDGQSDAFYRVTASHPALGGYRQGAMVMGDSMLVPVTPRPGTTVLAECVNVGTGRTRGPAIVANQYGQGRALYVGGSLEAHYVSSRVGSLRRVLASMIRFLARDAPAPFSLAAPRGVYGILRQAPSGDLALWVCANVGFKDAAVGRMRQEYLPVPDVVARVLIPEGRCLRSVELLRAGRSVDFTMEGAYAVIPMPVVHIAELVHLGLA